MSESGTGSLYEGDFQAVSEALESPPGRWPVDEVDERWAAVAWYEREAWLRFGRRPAPWENAPTFAERILKGDSNLTLENAAKLMVIFRSAYEGMVALDA